MRSGEAWNLQWIDLDFENRTVAITPEKGSNPRILPISIELVAIIKALPKKSEKLFNGSLRHFRRGFRKQRKRISAKLRNPRINSITFHTLRHFKATMEYHKTKNILYVKRLLGHKKLENTEIYTHLINFESDEWHVAHAKNLDEENKLIEAGFEYVRYSNKDEVAIYRKRK